MDCGNKILILNKTKLEDKGEIWFNDWLLKNEDLICLNSSLPPSSCTHRKLIVDLSPIDTKKSQFDWLKKNSDYICYSESYRTIYSSHIVNETWSDIDNLIETEIINNRFYTKGIADFTANGIDFETYQFQKVICFTIIDDDLKINLLNNYDEKKSCYSIPFFKSILEMNKFTDLDKVKFVFVEIVFRSKKTIAFKVTYDGTKISYYDYSDEPTRLAIMDINENTEV